MLKYVLLLIVFCPMFVAAQDEAASHDERMYQLLTQYRGDECLDFETNAIILIPDYYYRGEIDSINMIINYVERHCSDNPFGALKLLLKIENGDFPEDWCDIAIIYGMLKFPRYDSYYFMSGRGIPGNNYYFNESEDYLNFIGNLALDLTLKTDSNTVAHLLCKYYSGDVNYPLIRLHNRDFDGYCIQKIYDENVNEARRELRNLRWHWELQTGVWLPQGNSKLWGEKLETGLLMGFRNNSWGGDITCAVRGWKSRNKYFVEVFDTLAETDHFFSGLFGLDLAREVFHTDRFEFEGVAGIAYEYVIALTEDDVKDGKSLSSFNFNFGINTRLFFNKTKDKYVGLKLRYNIVNYKNRGGTDISGNSFALCLTFGSLGNKLAINEAKRLLIYD